MIWLLAGILLAVGVPATLGFAGWIVGQVFCGGGRLLKAICGGP